MSRLGLTTVSAAALSLALLAAPAFGFQCPMDMAAIDEALAANPQISAEQMAEVEDCIAVRGMRPVRWLLEHAALDARWTLVHATHLVDDEVRDLAASGATNSVSGRCSASGSASPSRSAPSAP